MLSVCQEVLCMLIIPISSSGKLQLLFPVLFQCVYPLFVLLERYFFHHLCQSLIMASSLPVQIQRQANHRVWKQSLLCSVNLFAFLLLYACIDFCVLNQNCSVLRKLTNCISCSPFLQLQIFNTACFNRLPSSLAALKLLDLSLTHVLIASSPMAPLASQSLQWPVEFSVSYAKTLDSTEHLLQALRTVDYSSFVPINDC